MSCLAFWGGVVHVLCAGLGTGFSCEPALADLRQVVLHQPCIPTHVHPAAVVSIVAYCCGARLVVDSQAMARIIVPDIGICISRVRSVFVSLSVIFNIVMLASCNIHCLGVLFWCVGGGCQQVKLCGAEITLLGDMFESKGKVECLLKLSFAALSVVVGWVLWFVSAGVMLVCPPWQHRQWLVVKNNTIGICCSFLFVLTWLLSCSCLLLLCPDT
jgi:hypothetical protein